MKKTIQFLFAMTVLFEGQNSFAGTNEMVTDKPMLNTTLASPTRGIQYLIVTVLDDLTEKPIAGATVNAPCTGLKPMLTNASGVAQFALSGNCNCNNATANVSTTSCNTYITLSCSSDNMAYCH